MTTFSQLIASSSRSWVFFVEVEGIGPVGLSASDLSDADSDGRYRFCTSIPTIGSDGTQPASLWLDYLTEAPSLLSEQADPFGGVADYGSASISILDVGDLLTSLLRTEARPVTSNTADESATDTSIAVSDSAQISARDVLYAGAEAMLVTTVDSGTLITVTRGYLGTTAASFDADTSLFPYIPYLRGRAIEVYAMPQDGAWSEKRLVGQYVIDALSFDALLNVWTFDGRSQIQAIDGIAPQTPQAARVVELGNGQELRPTIELQALSNTAAVADMQTWTGTQEIADRLFFLSNDKEVVAVGRNAGDRLLLSTRALAGTTREDPEVGRVMRKVLVAADIGGSFRFSAGPSPASIRNSAAWDSSTHWVDICLCILTSSAHEDDGLELTNFNSSYGNWSSLPVGYGLGVPHADIDWEEWLKVKERTDEHEFPNFVFGREAEPFGKIMTKAFLQPIGVFLVVVDGKIRPVLPSNPLAVNAAQTPVSSTPIGTDHILSEQSDAGSWVPAVSLSRDLASSPTSLRYLVGPDKVDVGSKVVRSGSEASTRVIDVEYAGSDAGPAWAARAQSRIAKRRSPPTMMSGKFDASLWDLEVGDPAAVTLPEVPDFESGTRGWTNRPATLIERNVDSGIDGQGVTIDMKLEVYAGSRAAFRVQPSGAIFSVASFDATLVSSRYTETDARNTPQADVDAFRVGDHLWLLNRDGTRVGSLTQEIQSISSDTLTLDGNFSGAMAAGLVLVGAGYDDADAVQQELYASMGDRDDGRLGTNDVGPFYYADI